MSAWEELKQECLACEACELCKTRTQVVFGVGDPEAEVLFIGEAPGKNEDEQGEPFVGRGGKLLDEMLAMIGLQRENICSKGWFLLAFLKNLQAKAWLYRSPYRSPPA